MISFPGEDQTIFTLIRIFVRFIFLRGYRKEPRFSFHFFSYIGILLAIVYKKLSVGVKVALALTKRSNDT